MIVASSEMSNFSTLVLDSWPLLELWRQREPVAQRVLQIFLQASSHQVDLQLSRINYGELFYKAVDYFGETAAQTLQAALTQRVRIVSVDDMLVDDSAKLKTPFRISYADCFAAALAMRLAAPIVTGDPDFLKLEAAGLVDVLWLGA